MTTTGNKKVDERGKLALSALGLMMLFGSISCASSTVTLILHTWGMAVEFGVREVLGYIVATGIVGILSLVAVPVLFSIGAVIAVGPWTEERSN